MISLPFDDFILVFFFTNLVLQVRCFYSTVNSALFLSPLYVVERNTIDTQLATLSHHLVNDCNDATPSCNSMGLSQISSL